MSRHPGLPPESARQTRERIALPQAPISPATITHTTGAETEAGPIKGGDRPAGEGECPTFGEMMELLRCAREGEGNKEPDEDEHVVLPPSRVER